MRTDSRKSKVEESCQSAGKKELSAERKCVLLCRKFFSVRRSRCDTVTTKTLPGFAEALSVFCTICLEVASQKRSQW